MLEIIQRIPNSVNIIVFIWAVAGLIFFVRNREIRNKSEIYFYFGIVGFMILWRIVIRIESSRYAVILIFPFVFLASVFLAELGKKRRGIVRLALYAFMAGTGFFILKMNVDSVTRNQSSDIVAEILGELDRTPRQYAFMAGYKDHRRIDQRADLNRELIELKEGFDLNELFADYRDAYLDATIVNTAISSSNPPPREYDYTKKIVSLNRNSSGSKKHLIYALTSDENNRCVPVAADRIPPYQPNLLENGDLEQLDSPEESYEKLKNDVAQYPVFYGVDDRVRAPRNVSFYSTSNLSSLSFFSALNDFSIDGKNSARITFPKGKMLLLFNQRFPSGKYEFSMLVQGKKGTKVSILLCTTTDNGREVKHLASITIPDKRVFLISSRFSTDELNGNDAFQVGAQVEKGEAYLDNFSLKKLDE